MRQTFTLWFVPFDLWQANVKLVTVLDLAPLPVDGGDNRPRALAGDGNSNAQGSSSSTDHHHDNDASAAPPPPRTRFFVRGQEDHYQVEEWLKFVAPWGASLLWVAWQLVATCVCAFGVLLWPFGLVRAVKRKQRQRQREKQQRM